MQQGLVAEENLMEGMTNQNVSLKRHPTRIKAKEEAAQTLTPHLGVDAAAVLQRPHRAEEEAGEAEVKAKALKPLFPEEGQKSNFIKPILFLVRFS